MSLIRGRFKIEANEAVARFTASLAYDRRLFRFDIAGSMAHAKMLAKQGIISEQDARAIVRGLKEIEAEIEQGNFQFKDELEDIHMNIEARLTEKIGQAGAKLHTARSRNDQVATDLRLFLKAAIKDTLAAIQVLKEVLVGQAEANPSIILPGYTHLQRAQPILLAHHLLAYFEMFERDCGRFRDCLKRADVLPLGSGALAGVAYDIDRQSVATELGFGSISNNSLDAVSDRDFVIEFEAAASLCMLHLSRLAGEVILWSSSEFGFIELHEAYTTGSSIMPQKKNPDVAELTRGKVGRVYGHLMAMLTTLKGLPLAYNRDLQEDKEGLFDTADTILSTLEVFSGMIQSLSFKPARMRAATDKGYLLATDLADYLVKKGEPFRSAHAAIGNLVNWADGEGKTFGEISLPEYKRFSALFEADVYAITLETSVASRDNPGGTAPRQVKKAIAAAKKALKTKGADLNKK